MNLKIDIPKPINDYVTEINFQLKRNKTALLIVDMQYASANRNYGLGKRMIDEGREHLVSYRFDRIEKVVLPNIQRLLKYCRHDNYRIMYITNGSKMPDYSDILSHKRNMIKANQNTVGFKEHEILEEIKPLKDECIINKTSTGAFNSSNIDIILKAMGIEYLLFTGVSTDVCVDLTAKDAVDRGYKCLMIENCLGAAKEVNHYNALVSFQRSFGRVDTLENVIKELDSLN